MLKPADAAIGDLLQGRYRLEQRLSEGSGMRLWRAVDTLASDLPVAIRSWWGLQEQQRIQLRGRLKRLQGVRHPQVPRLGALIESPGGLWQVREWVSGRTYAELLQVRRERQLVFGAGEVLLLLRQLLPALATLHGQELFFVYWQAGKISCPGVQNPHARKYTKVAERAVTMGIEQKLCTRANHEYPLKL